MIVYNVKSHKDLKHILMSLKNVSGYSLNHETPLLYAVYVDGYVYILYFLAQKKLAIAFFKNYRKF